MSLIASGLLFECEVLSTGQVSVTITDQEDGDLDIRVIPNGPGVREAVEEMVRQFDPASHPLKSLESNDGRPCQRNMVRCRAE